MTAPPRPTILAGMTPPEPGFLDILDRLAPIASAVAAILVVGIMASGVKAKNRSNDQRAEAEKRRAEAEQRRHEESMTALKELIRRTSPPQAGPADWPRERRAKAAVSMPRGRNSGPGALASP